MLKQPGNVSSGVEEFSEAIIEFWTSVPENIYSQEEMQPPPWFMKAVEQDRKPVAAK